jgi:hypothetical protein
VRVGDTWLRLPPPDTNRPWLLNAGKHVAYCAGCTRMVSTAPASSRFPLAHCEQQIRINRTRRTTFYCEDCTADLYGR